MYYCRVEKRDIEIDENRLIGTARADYANGEGLLPILPN